MASGSLQAASPEHRREVAILGGRASAKTRRFHKFALSWIMSKRWLWARIKAEYARQEGNSVGDRSESEA